MEWLRNGGRLRVQHVRLFRRGRHHDGGGGRKGQGGGARRAAAGGIRTRLTSDCESRSAGCARKSATALLPVHHSVATPKVCLRGVPERALPQPLSRPLFRSHFKCTMWGMGRPRVCRSRHRLQHHPAPVLRSHARSTLLAMRYNRLASVAGDHREEDSGPSAGAGTVSPSDSAASRSHCGVRIGQSRPRYRAGPLRECSRQNGLCRRADLDHDHCGQPPRNAFIRQGGESAAPHTRFCVFCKVGWR